MAETKREWLHILLDCSASMEEHWDEVIDILNGELDGFRRRSGKSDPHEHEVELSITPFSDGCGPTVAYASAEQAPTFTEADWETDGLTAFYDAMGTTLKHLSERWERERRDGPVRVNVVVLTAGGDTASKSYTLADIRAIVCRLQSTGEWNIRFPLDDLDWMEAEAIIALRQGQTSPCDEEGFRQRLLALLFDRKAGAGEE